MLFTREYLPARDIISSKYFTLINCIDCSLKTECTAGAKLFCYLPAINIISQMNFGELVHSHYLLIMQSCVFS